jgi:hypothetical protein
MKGDVGVIDCYKIIHNYLIYYDYFESSEDVSVLDELIYMYDKLKVIVTPFFYSVSATHSKSVSKG